MKFFSGVSIGESGVGGGGGGGGGVKNKTFDKTYM